jgi:Ni,Fe-hydrogenase III small subunit
MAWFLRGLRDGVVTTRYPRHPDPYADGFPGGVDVAPAAEDPGPGVEDLCPTGAIARSAGGLTLNRGRCILCGRCVAVHPATFAWSPGSATSRETAGGLVVPERAAGTTEEIAALRAELDLRVRGLRRSVHVRHIDAGSDGSEEWEIHALGNPTYDVHRLGIFFTASPRHADLLLVTGAGVLPMIAPLRRTYEAMPRPVAVVAVGTDAISGGLLASGEETNSGVGGQVGVDVWVPGSPPTPFAILHGILLALGRLPHAGTSQ